MATLTETLRAGDIDRDTRLLTAQHIEHLEAMVSEWESAALLAVQAMDAWREACTVQVELADLLAGVLGETIDAEMGSQDVLAALMTFAVLRGQAPMPNTDPS